MNGVYLVGLATTSRLLLLLGHFFYVAFFVLQHESQFLLLLFDKHVAQASIWTSSVMEKGIGVNDAHMYNRITILPDEESHEQERVDKRAE